MEGRGNGQMEGWRNGQMKELRDEGNDRWREREEDEKER